jgi:O-antigen ligase
MFVVHETMLNKNNEAYEQAENSETTYVKRARDLPTNPHLLLRPLLNLYISFIKESLIGKLLILLFLLLPWNLGKHFEISSSFIDSLPISYLIPTVYVQDLLMAAVVIFKIVSVIKSIIPSTSFKLVFRRVQEAFVTDAAPTQLFFLFTLAVFLSVFFAQRFYPSAYFFERFLLYFLFFLSALSLFRKASIRRWFFVSILLNVFLLGFLGFAQFYRQASVFNNYLFFGEQPYNSYTRYIAKESFNGIAKIPPYATFLHPNIFAGYVVVSLTLSLGYLLRAKKFPIVLTTACFLFCSFALYFTKSYTAWVALALGSFLTFFVRVVIRRDVARWFLLFSAFTIILLSLLFPFYRNSVLTFLPADSVTSTLSVERRSALLHASYKMIVQKPFFGWGINSFTYSFETFYNHSDVVRFLQPVHNVYALLAVETGFFGAALFILLTCFVIYRTARRRGGLIYSIVLLQIIFLSSFDHYFITGSQTLLLFILTLMMGLTYTEDSDCL